MMTERFLLPFFTNFQSNSTSHDGLVQNLKTFQSNWHVYTTWRTSNCSKRELLKSRKKNLSTITAHIKKKILYFLNTVKPLRLKAPPVIGPSTCNPKNTSDYKPPPPPPPTTTTTDIRTLLVFLVLLQTEIWKNYCGPVSLLFSFYYSSYNYRTIPLL